MQGLIQLPKMARATGKITNLSELTRSQFKSKRFASYYCSKDSKKEEVKRLKDNKCENKLCTPPPPPPKPGFWRRFFSCDEEIVKPPLTTCRKRLAHKKYEPPDLSFIDGQPFRTCGEAYIVQKNLLPIKPSETSRETRLVRKIEQPLHCLLDATEDPMDKITRAELRLIALHDKKLHPSYKQLDTIPKPLPALTGKMQVEDCPGSRTYNTISGPLDPNDIPIQLKFNRDLLDKKNIMYDFKRVEPPRDLVAPIIEMRKNQRPTLEKRRRYDLEPEVQQSGKMEAMTDSKCRIYTKSRAASYDTLQQGTTLLDSMIQMGAADRKQQNNVEEKKVK